MSLLPVKQPGLASQDSDSFTQNNAIYAKAPILPFGYAKTTSDLPLYSVVARQAGTNLIVLAVPGGADGIGSPIGVTTVAVENNDSNSGAGDSNSEAAASGLKDVSYAKDGEWNYDLVNKDGGWTLALLKAACDRTPLQFTQIKTASPGVPTDSQV